MNSTFHRRWLAACVVALLLSAWAGGFSVVLVAVFIGIYLTGAALIGPDDPDPIETTDSEEESPAAP
jgi:hypothetical protein